MIKRNDARAIPFYAFLALCVLCGIAIVWSTAPAIADDPPPQITTTPTTRNSFLPYVSRPLPTPTVTPPPPQADWLAYVNQFRFAANLHALMENPAWTDGAWLHSRYMVKEDAITHSENPGSPWYTPEGDQAGRSGNIYVSSLASTADESAINFWMAAPFHAVSILDPQLHETAFAAYRENIGTWKMGGTLDWQRGLGSLPQAITFPITFPANGGQTWLRSYRGGEWPDPLTACAGYSPPTGPTLIIQLGSGDITPSVTHHAFYRGAHPLPHCLFDETTYANPNSGTQNSGRLILNSRDAIILMPRDPLQMGETYTAVITTNGLTHTWSFTVAAPPALAPSTILGNERAGSPH
jgi:uncharacterized protein YkwD